MSEGIYLSVIVPGRNQGRVLKKTFSDIEKHIKKFDFQTEVVYIDGFSTDETPEVVESFKNKFKNFSVYKDGEGLNLPEGVRGKGVGIKTGILRAKGEVRVFMDADSSTPFHEIDKLLPYFKEGYDIVMGSRYTSKPLPATNNTFKAFGKAVKEVFEVLIYGSSKSNITKKKQSRLRQLISRGGNLVFVVLLGQGFQDTRCGFKAYTREAAETLFGLQKIPGFGFDTEILVIAKKYGYKIIEVPVDWYEDAEDTTINPIKDSIKSFTEVFKIKWYALSGKYNEKS